MKRVACAAIAAAFLSISGAAFADEHCDAPMAQWQPREALAQKLKNDGWKVKRIKTDDGCYEVYAFDKKGQRVKASFDPKTLEVVEIDTER